MTGDPIQDLLNHTPLTPTDTGTDADKTVGALLSQITNDRMTAYQKVKACYDWLIQNVSYGGGVLDYTERAAFNRNSTRNLYPGDLTCALSTDQLIKNKVDVCDDYSEAFVTMLTVLGLEAYKVGGKIGSEPHAWVNVRISGKYYLFDPQVEDNISTRNGGTISYVLFCKDQYPSGFNYQYEIFDEFIQWFHHFEPRPVFSVTTQIMAGEESVYKESKSYDWTLDSNYWPHANETIDLQDIDSDSLAITFTVDQGEAPFRVGYNGDETKTDNKQVFSETIDISQAADPIPFIIKIKNSDGRLVTFGLDLDVPRKNLSPVGNGPDPSKLIPTDMLTAQEVKACLADLMEEFPDGIVI